MNTFNFAGFSWPRPVAILPTGTLRERLKRKRMTGPYTHAPTPLTGREDSERSFYLGSDFAPGLRCQWCDQAADVRLIQHKGWYTDEDGLGDTIRGLVFRLPHGRGFLAGWSMGAGMISAVDYGYVYTTSRDAAYAADSMAERAAEKEREHTARDRAEQELEDSLEQVRENVRKHHLFWRGLSGDKGSADVAALAIERAAQLRAEVSELVKIIRQLREEVQS